jgi:hypothetical protein
MFFVILSVLAVLAILAMCIVARHDSKVLVGEDRAYMMRFYATHAFYLSAVLAVLLILSFYAYL